MNWANSATGRTKDLVRSPEEAFFARGAGSNYEMLGALFVSFNAKIVAHALKNVTPEKPNVNYRYPESVYRDLDL